jgi:ABC-type transporter Mla maintaining outer membrane lipid asymmetry ATPase subunit MlaF
MAGLLQPDSGEVYICGKLREGLASDDDNEKLRIGMVFQSAALFDSLTIGENVGFTLYEHSDLPEDRIKELVEESLNAVGLKGIQVRLAKAEKKTVSLLNKQYLYLYCCIRIRCLRNCLEG